jgi:four helix bundle protein
MREEDIEKLKKRFKDWAIKYVLFTRKFPYDAEFKALENQMVRIGSSAAANYRAACRVKSGPDFIKKMKIVEEELHESLFWLEFVSELNNDLEAEMRPLFREGNELLSIVVASIKTARK